MTACLERAGLSCVCAKWTLLFFLAPVWSVAQAGLIASVDNAVLVTNGYPYEADFVVNLDTIAGLDATNFKGRFFGQSPDSIWVAENGNLNFEGDPSFFPDNANQTARISPLWDDFILINDATGTFDNRIVATYEAGHFLAISWLNARLANETVAGQPFPSTQRSMQTLWFEGNTSISGFSFLADDIVFSYISSVPGTDDFGPINAHVGLDAGDAAAANRQALLPGASGSGLVTANDSGLLPWQTDHFVLFRWNAGMGNYDVSIERLQAAPIPLPASWRIVIVLLPALLLRKHAAKCSAD